MLSGGVSSERNLTGDLGNPIKEIVKELTDELNRYLLESPQEPLQELTSVSGIRGKVNSHLRALEIYVKGPSQALINPS